jgi:hypothetical protein
MAQPLFNLLTVFSLVCAVAAGVFWSRSYQFDHSQTGESLSFRRTDPLWWVISHRGTLTLCRQNGREWGQEFGKVEAFGFKFGGLKGPEGSLWNLQLPYWFIVTMLLVPPAGQVFAIGRDQRRRRRGNAGLCHNCGYDLRGTPDHCPECGEHAEDAAAVGGSRK